MNAKHHLIVLIVFSLSCMGASCGGSESSSPFTGSSGQVGSASDYTGPGSSWNVTLDGFGFFYITESETLDDPISMTVSGTYERHDSGFIELTVVDADGDDAPEADDTTVAIEIPGFGFLFQPFGADEEMIPLLMSGDCPVQDVTTNWITMTCNSGGSACDAESDSQGFFGTFDYVYATGQSTLSSRFTLDDGSDLGASIVGTELCGDGVSAPAGAVVYLSEEPGAVVHLNPDDHDEAQHMMGLPQQTLTAGDLAADYVGFIFDKNSNASEPVQMSVGSGGATGSITDVDPDALHDLASGASLASVSFDSVNMVEGTSADGWVTATYSAEGESDTVMYCTAATDIGTSGLGMLLCVGQSPTDTEEFYNLVMVSGFQ